MRRLIEFLRIRPFFQLLVLRLFLNLLLLYGRLLVPVAAIAHQGVSPPGLLGLLGLFSIFLLLIPFLTFNVQGGIVGFGGADGLVYVVLGTRQARLVFVWELIKIIGLGGFLKIILILVLLLLIDLMVGDCGMHTNALFNLFKGVHDMSKGELIYTILLNRVIISILFAYSIIQTIIITLVFILNEIEYSLLSLLDDPLLPQYVSHYILFHTYIRYIAQLGPPLHSPILLHPRVKQVRPHLVNHDLKMDCLLIQLLVITFVPLHFKFLP